MSQVEPNPGASAAFPLPPTGLEFAERLVSDLGSALYAVLDHSGVRFDDINARSGDFVIVGWNKSQWTALPDEAAPVVGDARKALVRLREFSACAARDAPDRQRELTELEGSFERLIEQPGGSYPGGAPKPTIDQVRAQLDERLAEYPAWVEALACVG
jgi:hypothetical protein